MGNPFNRKTSPPTLSETLFAEICEQRGFTVNKLKARAGQGVKTPDFEILAPTCRFIAEVKEILSVPDVRTLGATLGLKARYRIRESATQLETFAEPGLPLIVVLHHCDPASDQTAEIHAAMYADWDTKDGGHHTLTAVKRTFVSAVIVMSSVSPGRLDIYHNVFAAIPFPPEVFEGRQAVHWRKEGRSFVAHPQ